MTLAEAERKRELDQIEEFMRKKPHRVHRAVLGETSGWDELPFRERRASVYNKWKRKK